MNCEVESTPGITNPRTRSPRHTSRMPRVIEYRRTYSQNTSPSKVLRRYAHWRIRKITKALSER